MTESGDPEQLLTRAEVRRSINALIPSSPPDTIIDDAVFLDLANTLQSHPDTKDWFSRPRLYCLLRMLGLDQHSPIFHSFIQDNLHDLAFPFREIYLPMKLRDEDVLLENFLTSQWIVCSRTELMNASNFTSHMLTHRHIRDGHAHFDEYENLGRGGSASVERVRHKLSGLFFARKKILRGNNIATQQRKLEEFERELKALQRLRHKHLVSYVGSYTDLWSFSLILTPVAELELKTLLERQAKEPLLGEEVNWLRNAFGCIASALSYCHENRFRHKDIKPGNILLNDGQIYLCDFGISHDWNDLPTATTTGDPGKFTLRYCAPEVVNRQSRNEKSDVWSLACVYIEMISVIKGHSLQDLDRFLLNENSPSVDYWCQPEAAKAWLDHIRDGSPDDVALDWIEKMFRQNPGDRPTAADIVDDIQAHFHNTSMDDYFVGRCCVSRSQTSVVSPTSRSNSSVGPTDMTPPRIEHPSLPSHTTTASFRPVFTDRRPSQDSNSTPPPKGSSSLVPRTSLRSSASNTPPTPSSNLLPLTGSPGRDKVTSLSMTRSRSSGGRSGRLPSIPGANHDAPAFTPLPAPSSPPGLGISAHEHTGSGLACLCGAKGHERQLFEAPIMSLLVYEGTDLSDHSDECYGQSRAIRVYESMDSTVWKNTRRMVVSAPGSNSRLQCTSYWLPLTNIFSQVNADETSLWWSDCNHVQKRGTGAWGELYDWVYCPETPNHHVSIQMTTSQGKRLVDCLRSPSGDTEKVRQCGQVTLSENQAQSQFAYVWNIARILPRSNQLALDYRMLVLCTPTEPSVMYSTLYSVYPDIDFEMQLFDDEIQRYSRRAYRFQIKMLNLSSPTYISNLREEPEAKSSMRAQCQEIKEFDNTAVINFAIGDHHEFPVPPSGVVKLLKGITGWTMTFFGTVRRLKSRRSFLGKDYGPGDLILWERSSPSGRVCQLTFRVHADDNKRDPAKIWTAGSVKRGSSLSTSNDADAKLRVFNKASGSLLDIQKMTANDPRAEDTTNVPHRVSHDREEHSDVSITFSDARYRREFIKLIESFKESAAKSASSEVRRSAAHNNHGRVDSIGSEMMNPSLRQTRTHSSSPGGP